MIVLVVNAGSSSLKYQLLNMDNESVIAKGNCDRIGIDGHISHKTSDGRAYDSDCDFPSHTEAFEKLVDVLTTGDAKVIDSMNQIDAVGHRVVHGGEIFKATTLITDEVISTIEALKDLAPVHNPPQALAIKACQKVLPNAPMVAVFDTAFHQTMPDKAYMMAFPYSDYEEYGVRKYGFHGTSHRFVCAALADAMGKDIKDLKIISCHMGNGSSITAIKGGECVDTTMGFTPLDGLIMGTRCGSVDPSAVTFLMDKHGFTPAQMSDYMNKSSGLVGVSGISSDNRDVTAACKEGNKRAILANTMLKYQTKKYVGAYAAVMNGVDAILFTGGIGENDGEIRKAVCEDMDYMGIKIDDAVNSSARTLTKISTPDSKVEVWVVPTNEELLIARDTVAIVKQ